jgi:hypothetical protein
VSAKALCLTAQAFALREDDSRLASSVDGNHNEASGKARRTISQIRTREWNTRMTTSHRRRVPDSSSGDFGVIVTSLESIVTGDGTKVLRVCNERTVLAFLSTVRKGAITQAAPHAPNNADRLPLSWTRCPSGRRSCIRASYGIIRTVEILLHACPI